MLTNEENALFVSVISKGRSNAAQRKAETIDKTISEALKSLLLDTSAGDLTKSLVQSHGEENVKMLMAKAVTHIGMVISEEKIQGMKPTATMLKASSRFTTGVDNNKKFKEFKEFKESAHTDDADSKLARPALSASSTSFSGTQNSSDTSSTEISRSSKRSNSRKVQLNEDRLNKLREKVLYLKQTSRADIREDVNTLSDCKFVGEDMRAVHKELLTDATYFTCTKTVTFTDKPTIAEMQSTLRKWLVSD